MRTDFQEAVEFILQEMNEKLSNLEQRAAVQRETIQEYKKNQLLAELITRPLLSAESTQTPAQEVSLSSKLKSFFHPGTQSQVSLQKSQGKFDSRSTSSKSKGFSPMKTSKSNLNKSVNHSERKREQNLLTEGSEQNISRSPTIYLRSETVYDSTIEEESLVDISQGGDEPAKSVRPASSTGSYKASSSQTKKKTGNNLQAYTKWIGKDKSNLIKQEVLKRITTSALSKGK